jgi:hypothetical protein
MVRLDIDRIPLERGGKIRGGREGGEEGGRGWKRVEGGEVGGRG